MFLSISTDWAWAYPQTIVKGYLNCQSCHITASGGSVLTDYGRAMSEAFMSVWSRDGEAREFFVTEFDWIDYRASYQSVSIRSPKFQDDFHMASSLELAIHEGPLTFDYSTGFYGRDKLPQSRSSFLQYQPTRTLSLRVGYFFPTFGLGLNDHTLNVRRNAGLGRGRETYNIELYGLIKKKVSIFFTAASDSFKLSDDESGKYEIITPYDETKYFVRASAFIGKIAEIGANARASRPGLDLIGLHARASYFNGYILTEYLREQKTEDTSSYARLGYYINRGVDLYIERDAYRGRSLENSSYSLGLDVMIRPRFSVSVKINFNREKTDLTRYHLWL